jgi:hypothetical protein
MISEQEPAALRNDCWQIRGNEKIWFPIPDWVPKSVAEMACDIYLDELEMSSPVADLELIQRLATDPAMSAVWNELGKKKRTKHKSTTIYHHSANASGRSLIRIGNTSSPGSRQAAAMARLFRKVVSFALDDLPAFLKEPQRHPRWKTWTKRAKELRRDTDKLRDSRGVASQIRRILDAALAYEELTSNSYECPACKHAIRFSDGNSATDEAERLSRLVASECRKLFGTAMYRTVTTIVSVALNRNVTPASVRLWVAIHL